MAKVTDADREAAQALRVVLADASGFWHRFDDDSPLCQALVRHRLETERRLAEEVRREVRILRPAAEYHPDRSDWLLGKAEARGRDRPLLGAA